MAVQDNGYLPPITVDGAMYLFDGNVRKDGKRILKYLENSMGFHFIIRSEAYNEMGETVPNYVAIYVSETERLSDNYFKWWHATIKNLDV